MPSPAAPMNWFGKDVMIQSQGGQGTAKLSLWEFIWPNFFARFLGISVPTSYPADHKGFRCRFDRLFYYPLQSVDLENSPAPQIQGCLKASHLQLGPEHSILA